MITVLAIDIQNDFCDPKGSLYVQGAEFDVARCAKFISNNSLISDIHITMDTHHIIDISHPIWWANRETGKMPKPFEVVTNEFYFAANSNNWSYSELYLDNIPGQHVIWPEHCIIGTYGHNLHKEFQSAIDSWVRYSKKNPTYHIKGDNPLTEHYSAVKPEFSEKAEDVNLKLYRAIDDAKKVVVMGQASSHCVGKTLYDLISMGIRGDKFYYLDDCCSPVPGFEEKERDYIDFFKEQGVTVINSNHIFQ